MAVWRRKSSGLGLGAGDAAEGGHAGHRAGLDAAGLIEPGENDFLRVGEGERFAAGIPLEGAGVIDGEARRWPVAEGLGHDFAEADADIGVIDGGVRIGAGALGVEVAAQPAAR